MHALVDDGAWGSELRTRRRDVCWPKSFLDGWRGNL